MTGDDQKKVRPTGGGGAGKDDCQHCQATRLPVRYLQDGSMFLFRV